MKKTCRDTTTLGSFLESHDRPRFASQTVDLSLAKNAIGFMMFADGIPIGTSLQPNHFYKIKKSKYLRWSKFIMVLSNNYQEMGFALMKMEFLLIVKLFGTRGTTLHLHFTLSFEPLTCCVNTSSHRLGNLGIFHAALPKTFIYISMGASMSAHLLQIHGQHKRQ